MIVLDGKRKKYYENVNKTQAAKIMGVHRTTIIEWSKKARVEIYNQFTIIFDTVKMKNGVQIEF